MNEKLSFFLQVLPIWVFFRKVLENAHYESYALISIFFLYWSKHLVLLSTNILRCPNIWNRLLLHYKCGCPPLYRRSCYCGQAVGWEIWLGILDTWKNFGKEGRKGKKRKFACLLGHFIRDPGDKNYSPAEEMSLACLSKKNWFPVLRDQWWAVQSLTGEWINN